MPFLSNFCRNFGAMWGHQVTSRGRNHDRNSTETHLLMHMPFLSSRKQFNMHQPMTGFFPYNLKALIPTKF